MTAREANGLSLIQKIQKLPVDEQRKFIESLSENLIHEIANEGWLATRRESQCMFYNEDWDIRALIKGRGAGKTKAGTSGLVEASVEHGAMDLGVVGQTASSVNKDLIPAIFQASEYYLGPGSAETYKGDVMLRNGAHIRTFSAETGRGMRGPNLEVVLCDELAHWKRLDGSSNDPWVTTRAMVRKGMSRIIVTTTPLPSDLLRSIVEDPRTLATGGSTLDNPYLSKMQREYARSIMHTELGQQEVLGIILSGISGALWNQDLIDSTRVTEKEAPQSFDRVVVAVDPAVTVSDWSDYTGITVVGKKGEDGYVIDSNKGRWEDVEWAEEARKMFYRYGASDIIAESNQGGEMVRSMLRLGDSSLPVKLVHASIKKFVRAEPTALLYQLGRMHHIGVHSQLENEMVVFTKTSVRDDLVDSLVLAAEALGLPRPQAAWAGAEAWGISSEEYDIIVQEAANEIAELRG